MFFEFVFFFSFLIKTILKKLQTVLQPNTEFLDLSDDSPFPKQIGIKEATLLLIKEKVGRYALLRVIVSFHKQQFTI